MFGWKLEVSAPQGKTEDTRLPEPDRHRGSRRRARRQGEEHRQSAPGWSQGMADRSDASYEYRFDRRAGASKCGLEAWKYGQNFRQLPFGPDGSRVPMGWLARLHRS